MKKILYVDLDNVLVDFPTGIERLCDEDKINFKDRYDDCPAIFSLMDPVPNAIESFEKLSKHFDAYILSTAPWANPTAWMHKVEWVQKHLGTVQGSPAYKRLILTHRKDLNKGHFLVDDRTKNGAAEFEGELIHFGQPQFPDWPTVTAYLLEKT